jgi:hypothetical protein
MYAFSLAPGSPAELCLCRTIISFSSLLACALSNAAALITCYHWRPLTILPTRPTHLLGLQTLQRPLQAVWTYERTSRVRICELVLWPVGPLVLEQHWPLPLLLSVPLRLVCNLVNTVIIEILLCFDSFLMDSLQGR